MKRKLAKIAHSRAGDKGNTLVLSLFPFREESYGLLVKEVTAEKVSKFLSHQLNGKVTRHVLPELKGILFTCEDALSSGATTSLALDAHGKSLSYALLEMEIEDSSSN
jgi:hypothetical protein